MKCSVNFSRIKNKKLKKTSAHKNTRVFSQDKVENKLCKASIFWMNYSRIHRNMKVARDDSAAKLGWSDWCDFPLNASERISESKLLGLLYCFDRRSSWSASRDGLQHDHIRSDTAIISMNFNSYASLVLLFCFVFEHWTLYTIRMLAVFDFDYRLKLAI